MTSDVTQKQDQEREREREEGEVKYSVTRNTINIFELQHSLVSVLGCGHVWFNLSFQQS